MFFNNFEGKHNIKVKRGSMKDRNLRLKKIKRAEEVQEIMRIVTEKWRK